MTKHVTRLIEFGRDREAAEAGAHGQMEIPGGPMDVLSQLDEVGILLGGVVANISPDELEAPTPCSGFTVRGVLEHMVGGATVFAAAFRGEAAGAADTSDVLAAFGPALGGLSESMHAAGALDRTVHAPFGDMPGDAFARFVVLDGLVHGWDLATATGQPYAPSDALVADVEAFAAQAVPPLRDGSTFGDEITPSPGASPIERLAAFTGRQP